MSATDKMAKCTVRIECFDTTRVSVGSSFFCVFSQSTGSRVPVLITNRHVVEGFQNFRIVLSTESDARLAKPERRRILEYDQLDKIVVFHENRSIDLAAILLRPILDQNVNDGSTIYLEEISVNDFLTEDIASKLRFVEDVLVVGYPQGQWDRTRNLPLFRRGITASPAMLDYNGESKFLIDCSIFPGSSGSPVFLYNFPAYIENGKVSFGERCSLLGVVSSMLTHDVEGKVVEVDIPTTVTVTKSPMPSNLGVVIRAREILNLAMVMLPKGSKT
ncbi:MAG: serine protease [Albidovulum sp.]|nr:serine protease [Albidovulum sp.]